MPGYRAPEDTTRIASEIMAVFLDACAAGQPPRRPPRPSTRIWPATGPGRVSTRAPPSALSRALAFWTRLHGALSLELAGHFTGMGFDPAELYAAETGSLSNG